MGFIRYGAAKTVYSVWGSIFPNTGSGRISEHRCFATTILEATRSKMVSYLLAHIFWLDWKTGFPTRMSEHHSFDTTIQWAVVFRYNNLCPCPRYPLWLSTSPSVNPSCLHHVGLESGISSTVDVPILPRNVKKTRVVCLQILCLPTLTSTTGNPSMINTDRIPMKHQ
jgi:hypothetical protein